MIRKTQGIKNKNASKSFSVKEESTLLSFLIAEMPDKSRTTVKSLLSHKQVAVNGNYTTQFDTPLHRNDTVTIGSKDAGYVFSNPQLNILFEDEHLIIADKAAGLLSVGTDKDKIHTAYRILSDHIKRKNPAAKLFVLHRLDRETSGIMMFAKSEKVQFAMQRNWSNMVIERKYYAVVEKCPQKKSGRIVSRLHENSAMSVYSGKSGETAITNYNVLKTNGQYSLVELTLETGKKNQIRVHMQDLGCPVAGDKKYGAATNPLKRLALHAFKLKFVHPVTKKLTDYETPVPKRFAMLVKKN